MTATVGLAVFALGVFPISNWIPGGLADPGYRRRWEEWALGSLICVGVGIVSMLLVRERLRARISAWLGGLGEQLPSSPRVPDVAVATACFAAYAIAAQGVLSGKPLLIDEIVQVLQARTYATGALSTPADSARAFFSVLHVVDSGDRVYSQFPPGWPAMLVLPSLLRVEWIAGPLCGFIAVFVFSRILRRVFEPSHPLLVPVGALFFGLAPFTLFQFASHMSHGPAVMWLLVVVLALSIAIDASGRNAIRCGLLAGFALGCAFAVRPLDAVAFGIPAGVALLAPRLTAQRLKLMAVVALGGAIPGALVATVNALTTGHPLTFGYEALWGASHGLGFHAAPWGDAHTPARGIELLSAYVTRLNTYLFETPFPALLPAVAGLLLVHRLSRIEWVLLTGTFVHAMVYFAYWHDGFYLGPRFVLPWVPIVIILTMHVVRLIARAPLALRWQTSLVGAAVAGAVLSLGIALPSRVSQYRGGLSSMRTNYAAEAERAGVTNAIVFVRESWGARLVARLWALGVSRPATATLYAGVDACSLEHAVTNLERGRVRGSAAEELLRPLLADSIRVIASTVSPDTTERMLPGVSYDSTCTARVIEDRNGYALFPPFLLERESGNVYLRDLLAADTIMIDRNPGKRFFILTRDGVDGEAPLRWTETTRSLVVQGLSVRD